MPDYILPEQAPTLEQMATPNNNYGPLHVGGGPIKLNIAEPVADKVYGQPPEEDMLTKMSHTSNSNAKYEPSFFDWDKSGAQKYVNDRQYKDKGFDPELQGEGNELKYAQGQTGWDETKKMIGGFGSGLAHGFYDMAANWKNLASAAVAGNLSDVFKQGQLEEINRKETEFDNNWHIFQGEDPTVYSSIAKGIQNSGHFLGALGEIAAETIATQAIIAGTFGAGAPLEELNAARIAQMTTQLDKTINSANVIGNAWKDLGRFASKYVPGVGNTLGFGLDAAAYGAEGGAIATVGRGLTAFTNDIRSINVATGFAGSNAAGTYQQMLGEQTEQYKKANGGMEPGMSDIQNIQDRAMKAAKVDGALNAWSMLFLEKAAFGNILNSRSALSEAITNSNRGIFEKVGIKPTWGLGKAADAAEVPLYVKQQAKWYDFKANYWELGRHTIEKGVEFGAFGNIMGAVDKGVKSYFDAKYDNNDISGFDAIRNGIDSQFSKEGAKTFISGFVQGALLLGIGGAALGKVKDWGAAKLSGTDGEIKQIQRSAQASKDAETFVNKVNELWKDPLNPVKGTIHDMVLQSALTESGSSALSANNRKEYHDIKDDASREFLLPMIKNGLADMWIQRALGFARDLNQEQLCDLFKVPNTPENYESIKGEINELPGRVKELRRLSREVDSKLGNPFNPYQKDNDGNRLYKDGTEEFNIQYNNQRIHQIAKDYVVMMKDSAGRALKRQNDLLNGKGNDTGIMDMEFAKNLGFSDIFTTTSTELLDKHIADYTEILNLDPNNTDAKKAVETTHAYKEVLTGYLTEYADILNEGATHDRDEKLQKLNDKYKEELTDKLHEYLENSLITRNLKGKVVDRKEPPTKEQVSEAMDKLMDYYQLGVDHHRALHQLNIVLDPNIIKRFQMSFAEEGAKRQAEAKKNKEEEQTVTEDTTTGEPVSPKPVPEKEDEYTPFEDVTTTEPNPVTPTELGITNESAKPVVTTTNTDIEAVRDSIRKWIHDYPDTPLTPEAEQYLKNDKTTLKTTLMFAKGIYGDNDEEVSDKEIDKLIDKHFDKGVKPLSYPHLHNEPKVVEENGKWLVKNKDGKVLSSPYDSIREANQTLQRLAEWYDINGMKVQRGQYMYDAGGNKYVVKDKETAVRITNKGEAGTPVSIVDNALTDTKPESVPGKPEMPDNKYKLQNTYELTGMHPAGSTLEEREANQILVDKVLRQVSVDGDNFSIVVTSNNKPESTYDNDVTAGNPYITINREPNTIAIYRNDGKGIPMLYLTHPNKYQFTNPFTGKVSSVPDREWFEYVFDMNGKPKDEVYNQWMDNYAKSQQLAEVIDDVKNNNGGVLSGTKLGKLIKLSIGTAEFDTIPRERSDGWPTIQQVIDTGKEVVCTIDQNNGDVVYGEKPEGVTVLKEPNPLGRYITLFRLPGGDMRWVQTVTPDYATKVDKEVERTELDTFVSDHINEASKSIRELTSEGKLKEAEATRKLASKKLGEIFITQNPKDNVVVSLNMNMGKNGYINVGYKVKYKTDNGWVEGTNPLHITINAGPGVDKSLEFQSGEKFIEKLNVLSNTYLKKKGLPEIKIEPHNVRKSYPKGNIDADTIMQSKITTSTDIVKNIKLKYDVDKSVLYQDAIPVIAPVSDIESKKADEISKGINPKSDVSKFVMQRDNNDRVKYGHLDVKNFYVLESIAREAYHQWQIKYPGSANDQSFERIIQRGGFTIDELNEFVPDWKKRLLNAELKVIERQKLIEKRESITSTEQLAEIGYTPTKSEEQQIQELIDSHKDDPMAIFNTVTKSDSANKLIPVGKAITVADVVSIDEFDNWMSDNLPDWITRGELVPRLVNGHITAGEFVTSLRQVLITPDSPFKYHEAFHGVYRTLLSGEQQRALLDEAHEVNPITDKEFEDFQKVYGEYATKDDYQEEWIADKFDEWKANQKTYVPGSIKAWFQKLWNMLKELFNKLTGSQIESMFYKMDRGEFKHAKLQDNEFTATTSANDSALKLIELGQEEYVGPDGRKEIITKTLNQQDGMRLSSTIAALYHMQSLVSDHNKSQLLNSILDNYKATLNPNQQRYSELFTNKYKADKVEAVAWLRRLNEQYKLFSNPDSRNSLIEAVDEHLKLMGYKQDLEDDKVIKVENQVGAKNYDTNADEVGGYNSLQGAIREYIGSTVVPYIDEFGNSEFANGQQMYQAVDGQKIYNGLTQLLKNVPEYENMLDKLIAVQNTDSESAAVVRRLLSDTGFNKNEQGIRSIEKNHQLFIQFMDGFRQASVGHVLVEAGTNEGAVGTVTRAYEANRNSSARNQVQEWASAFDELYLKGYDNATAKKTYAKENTVAIGKLRSQLMNTENVYSNDNEFVNDCQKISNDIKQQLGISIHQRYIQYSIASNITDKSSYMNELLSTYTAKPIDPTDIYEIREVLLSDKLDESGKVKKNNPFIYADNRLKNIAEGNAEFDETVDSTNYKNAEGKNIYGFQKYNYILEKGIKINTDAEIEKLRNNPDTQLCHLLEDNEWLNWNKKVSLVDGLALRYFDIKGEEVSAPAYLSTNKSPGSTLKNFNTRELNYFKFSVYANPTESNAIYGTNVIPAIISDKSKLYIVNAPVIHSVYINKKGEIKIAPDAMDKLLNIVNEEIARIDRVKSEIDELSENNYIADWHQGKMSGLKFDRAKQMLGSIGKEYQNAIINNEANEEISKPSQSEIKSQIEKYFNETIGKYLNEDLIQQGLIEKSDKEYINKMLPEYLWKGIPGKKGDGLNLRDNFKFNISQIYISNFINADGFTHLLSPNGINTKRLSFWNADGPGAAKPNIVAPHLGIDRPLTNFHIAILKEPKDENGFDHADSQGWITEFGMRNFHWGFGTLTKKRASALDKVEKGEELSNNEVLGKDGLVDTGDVLNPLKPVYYDGYTGLKLSVHMLSKGQVMIKDKSGRWIPDPARMELYHIWKSMRDNEKATGIPSLVVPESASKLQTKSIAPAADRITSSHFNSTDANYWRKQLENPSNKTTITKPTQPVWQLSAEQNDDTKVYGTKIADIRKRYGNDVAQRLQNNWNNALNGVFEIVGDSPVDLSDTDIEKVKPVLGKFYDNMREQLQSTGSDEQTLGFLETRKDENGVSQPIYDLNFPATLEKFTQQVLNYFGRVMNEKVPGLICTKVSPFGHNIIREVYEVDSYGTPVLGKWRVVPRSEYSKDLEKYGNPIGYTDIKNRIHTGLKAGDIIIDHLRANVPEYKDGVATGINYSEYLIPVHHAEDNGSADSPVAMGYRNDIPYAAGNNGSVYKRVDTLPAYLGSIEVNPSIQSQAGGKDHDLDKDNLQMYDIYTSNGKLVKYGTATTNDGKFNEYLHYLLKNNKELRDHVKERMKNDAVQDLISELRLTEEQQSELIERISGNVYSLQIAKDPTWLYNRRKDLLNQHAKGAQKSKKLEEDIQKELEEAKAFYIKEGLQSLKLPATVSEFIARGGESLNTGVINNRELDSKIALAGNNHVASGDNPMNLETTSTALLSDLINPDNGNSYYQIFKRKLEEDKPNRQKSAIAVPVTTNFTRQSVKNDPEYLYLFTDNAKRTSGSNSIDKTSQYVKKYGQGSYPGMTQAVIRGLENAYPITTMVDDKRTQWDDSKLDEYKSIIDSEVGHIKTAISSGQYKGIKFAAQMPFGKGQISNMRESAPRVWNYMNEKLKEIGIDNTEKVPTVIEKQERSGLSEEQKRNIENLLRSFEGSDVNINEMRGQSRIHANISAGKGSVGIAANGVPVLSFVQQHNVVVPGNYIRFGGVDYNKLNETTTTNGTRKFNVLMTYINAMTDNAKLDGLAAKLGLTREALSDAMVMNMVGMNIDDAVLYMLQPSVKKYYNDIAYLRGTLKSSDESKQSKNRVLQEAIESYGSRKPHQLTRKDLEDAIVNANSDIEGDEQYQHAQLSALLDIQKAQELGSALLNLSNVLGIAGGLPVSWEEIDGLKESLTKLGVVDGKSVDDYDGIIDIRKELTETDPITSKYIKMLTQIDKLSPLLFIEKSELFKRMQDIQVANLKVKPNERELFVKQLKYDMIGYLSISNHIYELEKKGLMSNRNSLDNGLIYEASKTPGQEDITEIVNRLKKTLKGRKANYFVNQFLFSSKAGEEGNRSGINKLDANNWAKLSNERQIQLRDSFMQLVTNPDTRIDGLKIFNYLLVKDGGQFKDKSFIKYVAPALFKDLSDSTARVSKALVMKEYSDADAVKLFGEGKDWNYMMNNFVSNYGKHVDNNHYQRYIKIPFNNTPAMYYEHGNLQIDLMKGDIKMNAEALKNAGLNIIWVDSGKVKEGEAVMYRAVEFPRTFKSGEQMYELLNDKIGKGQLIATGTRAVYKPIETTGARGTFKAGGATFGKLPDTSKLITKTPKKETITQPNYLPGQKQVKQEIVEQESPEPQIQANTPQEAIKQLSERHGITIANVAGKAVAYKNGEVYNVPAGMTPKQLLESLDNPKPAIVGTNIISGSNDALSAALTNPTTIAKRKGTIIKDYPVMYNGIRYPDAEAAYKSSKVNDDVLAKKGQIDPRNNEIMQKILVVKLEQYPNLVTGITGRGGVEFLEASSHIGFGNRFEGQGKNSAFINNLIEAYKTVAGQKLSNVDMDYDENDGFDDDALMEIAMKRSKTNVNLPSNEDVEKGLKDCGLI